MKVRIELAVSVAVALAAALLLCSCASSERMLRLSGRSFQAPDASRLSASSWSGREQAAARPLNREGALVNLWPFFYRNDDYVSVLWPIFDHDRYGLAVRPFFNREGDEYSILFPLSAWNPVNGDGWAGPLLWNPDYCALLPLWYRSETAHYLLPVLINYDLEGRAESGGAPPWFWFRPGYHLWAFPLFYYRFVPDRPLLVTPLGGFNRDNWIVANGYCIDGHYGLAPLFHWGGRDGFNFFGPLWFDGGKSGGFFPLVWLLENHRAVLPFYAAGRNYWWTPLVGRGGDADSGSRWFNLLGPLFLRERDAAGSFWWCGVVNYYRERYREGFRPVRSRREQLESHIRASREWHRLGEEAGIDLDEKRWGREQAIGVTLRDFLAWPLFYYQSDGWGGYEWSAGNTVFWGRRGLSLIRGWRNDYSDGWNVFWLFGGDTRYRQRLRSLTPPERSLLAALYGWEAFAEELAAGGHEAAAAAKLQRGIETIRDTLPRLLQEAGRPETPPATVAEAEALLTRLSDEFIRAGNAGCDYALPWWWSDREDGRLRKWLVLGGLLGYGFREEAVAGFNLLGILARWRAGGGRSEFRILEYLYCSERDGDMRRDTLFPFITWERRGGEETRFSFLWRLFAWRNRNGRHSGYLFFIPFGSD